MRKLILILILTSISISIFSQQASGRIHFEKGTTVRFFDVNTINVNFEERSIFIAKYQGAYREIPFDKLKEFKIIEWSYNSNASGLYNVSAEITTKTGVSFKTSYGMLFYIKVQIRDDLTGGLREKIFFFQGGHHIAGDPKELNIRKIVFDDF